MIKDCTCRDAGVCNACVLASYDRDPFAQALEHAVDVVTRPANVVDLKRWSVKA
jgi:hypothetical protein